ncbi:MAG TPA: hypothetical protein DEA22_00820 [Blastocatellia bacterium]|nr:hypothetical protein [Blastocatellia bacterium]
MRFANPIPHRSKGIAGDWRDSAYRIRSTSTLLPPQIFPDSVIGLFSSINTTLSFSGRFDFITRRRKMLDRFT